MSNSKKEMKPVDLGHLEDKAQAVKRYLEASHDDDRSPEYRAFMLERAENVADSLVRDFAYYFDTYLIGGMEPYGLSNRAAPSPNTEQEKKKPDDYTDYDDTGIDPDDTDLL